MRERNPADLYDEHYFANCCGPPYRRDDHWMTFFGLIAERIVIDLKPRIVMDAGCAMGFLVEILRDRDVEAYGVDISNYAIGNVHEDVRPYCWVGSITEEFPKKYDLIVAIEVFEHLSEDDARKAAENFYQHGGDVLFSSTPFDFEEKTHVNVQEPEYWVSLFSEYGYYHDPEYAASYITDWAMLFRKM